MKYQKTHLSYFCKKFCSNLKLKNIVIHHIFHKRLGYHKNRSDKSCMPCNCLQNLFGLFFSYNHRLQVLFPLRSLAIIMVILIFEAAARNKRTELEANHSLRFLSQDILLLPMLRMRRIFPCITGWSYLYFSPRVTRPRYCNLLV